MSYYWVIKNEAGEYYDRANVLWVKNRDNATKYDSPEEARETRYFRDKVVRVKKREPIGWCVRSETTKVYLRPSENAFNPRLALPYTWTRSEFIYGEKRLAAAALAAFVASIDPNVIYHVDPKLHEVFA